MTFRSRAVGRHGLTVLIAMALTACATGDQAAQGGASGPVTTAPVPGQPFSGRWTASFTMPSVSGLLQSRVTIAGSGGTWQGQAKGALNPCAGQAFPISVITHSETALVFRIDADKVLAGCDSPTVSVLKQSDGSLSGTLGSLKVEMRR